MEITLPNIKDRARQVQEADNQNPERFLDYGWARTNEAFLGMDSGVILVAGSPNHGKSHLIENISRQIIINNANSFVLDFSLDDDFQDRVRKAVASMAKIPINWVKLPSGIPEEAKKARDEAYDLWGKQIAPRLQIIDETDFDGKSKNLSMIRAAIEKAAENLPDKIKLVVTIDGFHNIINDEHKFGDELEKQADLSASLKTIAASTRAIVIASSHIQKHKVKRGLDHDAVKGSGATGYDAKIIGNIYSDFKANRGNADVFFDTYLPHSPDLRVRQPVIELDVRKNKAGSFSDIIFYRHYPEYAYVEEAPIEYQKLWKSVVYGES